MTTTDKLDPKTKDIGDRFLMAGYILSKGQADVDIKIDDAMYLVKIMSREELERNVREINKKLGG